MPGYVSALCQSNFPNNFTTANNCGFVPVYFYQTIQKNTPNGITCYPEPWYFDFNLATNLNKPNYFYPNAACVPPTAPNSCLSFRVPNCIAVLPAGWVPPCTNNDGYTGLLGENYATSGFMEPTASTRTFAFIDFNLVCFRTIQNPQGTDLNIVFKKELRFEKRVYIAENKITAPESCKIRVFNLNSGTVFDENIGTVEVNDP